ncbi:MAG: pyridoxal 5'-phosphate synthase glutaminase subunit PdxT [Acidimicrobiales bacterium]
MARSSSAVVGVLALQGAFAAHQTMFERLGVRTTAVRQPAHLVGCDALVLPGGESTTMSKLAVSTGLFELIEERLADGMPAFGTCAGAIMLARHIGDGRPDQRSFEALDMSVRRNGYGRQINSFETEIAIDGLDEPFHATFIRAPIIDKVGADVRTLSALDENPVVVSAGAIMATTFHPELGTDDRLHRLFLDAIV